MINFLRIPANDRIAHYRFLDLPFLSRQFNFLTMGQGQDYTVVFRSFVAKSILQVSISDLMEIFKILNAIFIQLTVRDFGAVDFFYLFEVHYSTGSDFFSHLVNF